MGVTNYLLIGMILQVLITGSWAHLVVFQLPSNRCVSEWAPKLTFFPRQRLSSGLRTHTYIDTHPLWLEDGDWKTEGAQCFFLFAKFFKRWVPRRRKDHEPTTKEHSYCPGENDQPGTLHAPDFVKYKTAWQMTCNGFQGRRFHTVLYKPSHYSPVIPLEVNGVWSVYFWGFSEEPGWFGK